jgi:hypothetical protein
LTSGRRANVRGERAEAGEQARDELVFVGQAEQCVRPTLLAEGAGSVRRSGGRAERAGTVRGIDGQLVGECVEAAEPAEHLVRQGLGELRSAQVSAADRAHHQRAAREQRGGGVALVHEVGVVVGRMTRSRNCDQLDPRGELDVGAVGEGPVRRREPRRRGREEHDVAATDQARAPGHVVGVRVRVDGPGETKPEPVGELLLDVGEARGIDERGGTVAEIDQVRRVAEALVHERVDPHHPRNPQRSS